MSCVEARQLLLELPVDEFGRVAHLEHCAACRAAADRIIEEESVMYQAIGQWVERDDMPQQSTMTWWRQPTRLLQAAVLLLAAGGALMLATQGDVGERAAAPPPVPMEEADLPLLQLSTGKSVVLEPPALLTEVEIDTEIAEVVRMGTSIQIIGVSEGETTVTLHFEDNRPPSVYLVEVTPPMAPSGEADITLAIGASETFELPEAPSAFSVADRQVATLEAVSDTELRLSAVSAGATDIVIRFGKGNPPVIYSVEIVE